MRVVIDFGKNEESKYNKYLKDVSEYEKAHIKFIAQDAIQEYINEKIEREERYKKQLYCEHNYKETGRDSCDPEGNPYYDESGEGGIVERVSYRCKKCDQYKSEFECREW